MTATTNRPAERGLAEHSHGAGLSESGVPMVSRGQRFTSYDVDAFEVPTGREEDWRFTPLRRLRGLHQGAAATGTARVTVEAAEGVTAEEVDRSDSRLGDGGVPADRVAAQAWSSAAAATVVSVPPDTRIGEPVTITLTGPGAGELAYGHLQIRLGSFAEAVFVLDYRGSGTY
ncbi:MAG TPA: Fe-S cluster assembly protein SufD, partial [Pseudonocardiaceae bacterium]|nr:Fe-S cluster assembly protein SufD [Pseudonocardiaceae bacterium]